MSDRDQLIAAGTNHEAATIMRAAVRDLAEERARVESATNNLRLERERIEELHRGFHCASCDGHACPDV